MDNKIPQVAWKDTKFVSILLPEKVWRETRAKAALMGRTAQDLVAGCLVMVLDIDVPLEEKVNAD